jgi:alkylation response protein AidB-like acyl-CoA dehydrogenase
MMTEFDKATFWAYQAARKLSQRVSASRGIFIVNARAGDASHKVCLLGVKIHGGVRISEDHDIRFSFG